MFSSKLGLFSKIICPVDFTCDLPNCLFKHEEGEASRAWRTIQVPDEVEDDAVSNKRLKMSEGSGANLVPVRSKSKTAPFVGKLVQRPPTPPSELDDGEVADSSTSAQALRAVLEEIEAPISPPPVKRAFVSGRSNPRLAVAPPPPTQKEALNPRMLSKPPASHASRLVYLKKLHEFMSRLNDQLGKSKDPETKALKLDDAQLIRLALDDEERIASENTSVYPNMIKLHLHSVSKMTLEQWKVARMKARIVEESRAMLPKPTAVRDLSTGLSIAEEVQILPHLAAVQKGLEPFGYVTSPPTLAEIYSAKEAVVVSQFWEQCERCKSRFQVFPDRAEDGSLTSGGTCKYHHGRAMWPIKEAGRSTNTGPTVKTYSCCGEPVGLSTGCTTHPTHVYKIYDGKRLASIMQFQETPHNMMIPADRAVAFDCEMAFTVHGMELIRLTATAWPDGKELLDVLVKPLGAILDLNTRYSGVKAADFVSALPYDEAVSQSNKKGLRIVDSPAAARQLMFKLMSPATPLIGHAIENDLNVTRIVHPCIIDTVLLFPARGGLPNRRALRVLTEEMLWRKIQVAGSDGHDSKEDANAAMDLVRLTLGRQWRKMQGLGYKFEENGKLSGPVEHASKAEPSASVLTSQIKRSRDEVQDAGESLNY